MIYQVYRAHADFLDLVRPLAAATGTTLRLPWPLLRPGWPLRMLAGALETFANLTLIQHGSLLGSNPSRSAIVSFQ